MSPKVKGNLNEVRTEQAKVNNRGDCIDKMKDAEKRRGTGRWTGVEKVTTQTGF